MPTQNRIEVINVSTDVYRLKKILTHAAEEAKSATYEPLIHKRMVTIKGKPRTAFNIVRRIVSPFDQAFVEEQKNVDSGRRMTYPFFCTAEKANLFRFENGELVKA